MPQVRGSRGEREEGFPAGGSHRLNGMSLFADNKDAPRGRGAKDGWIHAHCDGGARGNPGPAGFGALVTDGAGETLAELSEFLGNRTNNYAEYSGLLAVLAWTLEHGYRRLKVVSDSELMVRQIQGRYKVNSPDLKPLWQEARARIARLEGFEIAHALRHKNKAADALANAAMDRGTGKSPDRAPAHGAERQMTKSGSSAPAPPRTPAPAMLRGFIRDGAVHLLGTARLPDGIFVKIIPE